MQIQPCGPLRGEITVPGDKSISHRAVMLGALANGTTHITGFLMGEDCLSTIDCFRKMGVEINITDDEVIVEGVGLHGLEAPSEALYTGNSGTTTRLLCGILGGMLIALFHAILSVRYRMNQVISGIGLNLLATAATTLLMQVIWKNKGTSELVASIDKTIGGPIPIISGQSFNFFVMVAVAVISWIVLFRTRYGLRLRMVGEQPKAASAVGL